MVDIEPPWRVGLDIGGTLAKVAFVEEQTDVHAVRCPLEDLEGFESLSIPLQKGRILRFIYFLTKNIEDVITFVKVKGLAAAGDRLRITGGGAYKFKDRLRDALHVDVQKVDEMQSLMCGLHFLMHETRSVYRYDCDSKSRIPVVLTDPIYPFLLVNIGSGVSILKAEGPGSFTRVTGTCIGGGTVLGLARQLCGAESFDQVLEWAEKGSDLLDLKVGDLFGDAAGSQVLPADTLASSFGRLYFSGSSPGGSKSLPSPSDASKEDVCRSLVHMVSYNIGYIAFLAGSVHGVSRVFFSGKFVNNRWLTMQSLTHGVRFYISQYGSAISPNMDGGAVQDLRPIDVLFLRHDGYLGSIGCLLDNKTDNEDEDEA